MSATTSPPIRPTAFGIRLTVRRTWARTGRFLGGALIACTLFVGAAIPAAAAELTMATFVRRGQSAGNASGNIDTSTLGPVLTQTGQQQAQAVPRRGWLGPGGLERQAVLSRADTGCRVAVAASHLAARRYRKAGRRRIRHGESRRGQLAVRGTGGDLLGEHMLPLRIPWYLTVLDLGAPGAVYTEGWWRVKSRGRQPATLSLR
ncbi:hypothetical protein [Mycobacterium sp. AZCC_0083]|uniref:hypothetical protein n=1 Tax=Mycobacterium sp. AZCC_0083 TaxID=2735882 RepID=UPI0017B5D449|nr:hypothetical protein [Mycobacterium sp. AZCC_0083]MBB5166414.1 fermentation-respiration switch protein FrsA (DUF1100 family) [Mycobacterium sp. AZCC_0083]